MSHDQGHKRRGKRLLVAAVGVATVSYALGQAGCADDPLPTSGNLMAPSDGGLTVDEASVTGAADSGNLLPSPPGTITYTSGNLLPPPDASLDAASDASDGDASDASDSSDASDASDASKPTDAQVDGQVIPPSGNLLPPPSGNLLPPPTQ
jgi:hypothetical protein